MTQQLYTIDMNDNPSDILCEMDKLTVGIPEVASQVISSNNRYRNWIDIRSTKTVEECVRILLQVVKRNRGRNLPCVKLEEQEQIVVNYRMFLIKKFLKNFEQIYFHDCEKMQKSTIDKMEMDLYLIFLLYDKVHDYLIGGKICEARDIFTVADINYGFYLHKKWSESLITPLNN